MRTPSPTPSLYTNPSFLQTVVRLEGRKDEYKDDNTLTYDWQTTFARAIHNFGDTPGPQLEQSLHDHFELHPQAVSNAISKIIDAHKAGRVRSPWGALKTEVDRQIAREALVDDSYDTRATIQRAEQWIRNAGLMFPTWSEARAELLTRDQLAAIVRTSPSVLDDLETLWNELRPLGVITDQEELERAERWKQARTALASPIVRDPSTLRARALALSQRQLPSDAEAPLT